jgi:hypothetical protein
MKVITWNCNGAFRKNYHALDELQADVLVIQKFENPGESTQQCRECAGRGNTSCVRFLELGQGNTIGHAE